jgi:DNA-directed RNA polymerase subunit RPC12/RpoP
MKKEKKIENNERIITRDITCLHCGHSGLLDIHDEQDEESDGRLFLHLGHNPFSGDLHYQCPACGITLLVDPVLALGERPIMGIPQLEAGKKTVWGEDIFHGYLSGFLARVFIYENSEHRLS